MDALQKSKLQHVRMAGICGNRTHPGSSSLPSPVLKTGGHTSTHLLPCWAHYSTLAAKKQVLCPVFGSAYLKSLIEPAKVSLFFCDAVSVIILQNRKRILSGGMQQIPHFRKRQGFVGGKVRFGYSANPVVGFPVPADLRRQKNKLTTSEYTGLLYTSPSPRDA